MPTQTFSWFEAFFGANRHASLRAMVLRPVREHWLFGACVTALFAYPLFWLLDTGSTSLVWLALVVALVFAHSPMYGPQAAFLSELFDTRVRYSGASLGCQLSSVIAGGLSPFIATALLPYGRGGPCGIHRRDVADHYRRSAHCL